jgi:catechol 2,3-dioxygenase-like lactoylglutathione lyase family enzyme
MLEAIHHVALICSDYERSKHFYSKYSGYRSSVRSGGQSENPGNAIFSSAPLRSNSSHFLMHPRGRPGQKHAAFVTLHSG